MMTVMVPDMLEPTEELRALSVLVARDLHHVRDLVLAAYEGGGFPRTLPSAAFAKDNIGEFGGQSSCTTISSLSTRYSARHLLRPLVSPMNCWT